MRRICLLSFILISFTSIAQRTPDYIHEALTQYMQVYPQEKVYLHTDKPYYSAGDSIWFKAYLVDATFHFADSASGVLYVDLINQRDKKIIEHKLLKVSGGFAAGKISLSDSLREGIYQLRAYTNWMLNFSEAFFFQKPINIYETSNQTKRLLESELEKLSAVADVQFFPEGGQLVADIKNTIGFKSVNHLGKGSDFSGHVISNENDTVAFIKSRHLGMGNFTLVPEKGKSYTLHVIGKNHEKSKFHLPKSLNEGYVITVNNFNKSSIKVFVNHNFNQVDRAILVGHQRGRVFYAAQIGSDKKEYFFSIPKDSILNNGIAHLTLFNGNGVPQCERIIYIDKNDPLTISLTSDKSSYKPREKIKLDIKVHDQKGKPVKGNFSLAVIDKQQANGQPFDETIESYLLLSSDAFNTISQEVKGFIEQPGYYFDRKNPNALVNLDLLLSTQGWRRFSWTDVLADSLRRTTFEIERGVTVSGQVLQPNGKQAKNAIDLVFLLQGRFITGSTNASGRFTLHDLNIRDSTILLVQGTKSNGSKNVNVHIDEPFIPNVNLSMGSEYDLTFSTELQSWLNRKKENEELMESFKLNKVQILKTVEVKAKREEVDSRRIAYGTGNFRSIDVDEKSCIGAINILQLMRGKFAGVEVYGNGFDWSVTVRGEVPEFFLDGIRLTDMASANSISPCDVESIDVINGPVLNLGSLTGVISILTRRGNSRYDWSKEEAMGITINKVMGFDIPREFYAPKYETNDTSVIPDYRSTIYWHPFIKTDSEGKAQVEFWNSDEKTTIKAILEGISPSGKPATTTFEYVVK